MNVRYKTLAGAGIVGVFAVAGIVLAQNSMPSSLMMMHPPKPMILTVGANGHGILRGVVESVATSSLTVAAWGGTWTVNIGSNAMMTPANGLGAIVAGDFVGVSGMVSEDGPIITADHVRDWSTKHTMMKDEHMMSTSTNSTAH